MLADSNLLIYAAKPEYAGLEAWMAGHVEAVSAVSLVEVLGYHLMTPESLQLLTAMFAPLSVIYPSPTTFDLAVNLRQQRKMSLGDALIAATCLEHGEPLATANVDDFKWIAGLTVVNPLATTGT
jgi:predicted nucleic acid-binding protein